MGSIAANYNQITLFYHPRGHLGYLIEPYAQSLKAFLRLVDLSKEEVTGTQWVEIARGLDVSLDRLIDSSHPVFREKYGLTDPGLSDRDWIHVLQNEPLTLHLPILLKGNDYHFIDSILRFTQLMEGESRGIDRIRRD